MRQCVGAPTHVASSLVPVLEAPTAGAQAREGLGRAEGREFCKGEPGPWMQAEGKGSTFLSLELGVCVGVQAQRRLAGPAGSCMTCFPANTSPWQASGQRETYK